jgi:hypothetical protein
MKCFGSCVVAALIWEIFWIQVFGSQAPNYSQNVTICQITNVAQKQQAVVRMHNYRLNTFLSLTVTILPVDRIMEQREQLLKSYKEGLC